MQDSHTEQLPTCTVWTASFDSCRIRQNSRLGAPCIAHGDSGHLSHLQFLANSGMYDQPLDDLSSPPRAWGLASGLWCQEVSQDERCAWRVLKGRTVTCRCFGRLLGMLVLSTEPGQMACSKRSGVSGTAWACQTGKSLADMLTG